jgi:hypothetical protein
MGNTSRRYNTPVYVVRFFLTEDSSPASSSPAFLSPENKHRCQFGVDLGKNYEAAREKYNSGCHNAITYLVSL